MPEQKRCVRCGAEGHLSHACRRPLHPTPPLTPQCTWCGGFGHTEDQCPKKEQDWADFNENPT